MADIFLTVFPITPTVPTLNVATNKDRTSNLVAPHANSSIVSFYKQRRTNHITPALPSSTTP